MIKLIASIIIASLVVLIFQSYWAIVLNWLTTFHQFLYQHLDVVFSSGKIGTILRNLVALLFIPLIAVGIPSLIYYIIYRKKMPYFDEAFWAIWIVIATIIIVT